MKANVAPFVLCVLKDLFCQWSVFTSSYQDTLAKTKTYHSVGSTFLVTAVSSENSIEEPCLKKYIQQEDIMEVFTTN
jgi:hypothetical protein